MLKTAWSELKRVCFDLERFGKILSHIDSAGMGLLVRSLWRARDRKRDVRVARLARSTPPGAMCGLTS